jgi:hypothetical protein
MSKGLIAFLCVAVLGLALGGCTQCGWIWEQGARSCHATAPRQAAYS